MQSPKERSAAWLAALALAALLGRADAQVNIEKLRRQEPHRGVSGVVGLDLRARSGNVEVWEFGIQGQVTVARHRSITLLITQGELGWKDGERYSNEGLIHLRQELWRSERAHPEIFTQIDYNRARRLAFRGLAGGGLRVLLHHRQRVQIWWGTSYMLEHERLEKTHATGPDHTTTAHRWSNYLNVRADIDERTRSLGTVYAQPRFDAPGDVRVLADARLEVDLVRSLSLKVSAHARYDSRPPVGVEDLDIKLGSGLQARF